jgi:hypothetical protein
MKRQIFTLLMALVLTTAALVAQSTPTPNPQVPPSQQVDQSGQPECTAKPGRSDWARKNPRFSQRPVLLKGSPPTSKL